MTANIQMNQQATILKHLPLTLAILLLLCLPAAAREITPRQETQIGQAMRAQLDAQRVTGVAVGYLRDGKVVYTAGYGFADREKRRQMTSKSVINWASNSKPLMAILALQLMEQGMLDLDTDIHNYLPDYPPTDGKITARLLLCHQSGVPHYKNGKVVGSNRRFTERLPYLDPENSLHMFDRSPLLFSPGARYSYSSYGYVLLSAVVQAAGKQPIERQLQTRVIEPLGLTSLELDLPDSKNGNWAAGYKLDNTKRVVRSPEYAHYWKHGAGAYKSNIADFARWAQALMGDELISAKTRKLMWTRQPTTDKQPTEAGLGIFVTRQNGALKLSHNGSQEEARSRLVLYPEARHGVVILSNSNHANPGKFSTALYTALRN